MKNALMYGLRRLKWKLEFGDRLIYCSAGQMFKRSATIKISNYGCIKMGNMLLNENAFLCCAKGEIIVGNNVSINRNSIIVCKDKIEIGDNCSIGPNVCIYDHDHSFSKDGFQKSEFFTDKIHIGNNCWIGAGVTILRGTDIGNNCIIGAGVILKGNIPAGSLVCSDRELYIKKLK